MDWKDWFGFEPTSWDRFEKALNRGGIGEAIRAASVDDLMEWAQTAHQAELLSALAGNWRAPVRCAVAGNLYTPRLILILLAFDTDLITRVAVARNPLLPEQAMLKLANDDYWDVRCALAENPYTLADLLRKLAEDEDEFVRGAAADNPHTPKESLIKLMGDSDIFVAETAAKQYTYLYD